MIQRIAAAAIAIAGVVHLILVPEHLEHAVVHAVFFAIVGLAEILWAGLFWSRPVKAAYFIGFALAGGLIALWAITRAVAPPFEPTPGPVEASGLLCKLAELAGLGGLAALATRGMVGGIGVAAAWRSIGLGLAIAVAAGLGLYGVGRAAEPLLPGLASTSEHAHEEAVPSETIQDPEPSGHEHVGGEHVHGVSGEAVVLGSLTIETAWARPAHAGDNSAVYFVLTNSGDGTDRLVGVASEAAHKAELHRTTMEGDVMRMEPLPDGVDVPPHSQVVLKPGGYHVMLIGLTHDLVPGEQVMLTLRFESAGEVALTAIVAEP
jgi:copper(I)-binding protein